MSKRKKAAEADAPVEVMEAPAVWGVKVTGTRVFMFHRNVSQGAKNIPPEQRFYFAKDGKTLVLPVENLFSMLSAQNRISAAKLVYERGYKDKALVVRGFAVIEPQLVEGFPYDPMVIPFLRDGKPIVFGDWVQGSRPLRDGTSGCWVLEDKGNPRGTPVQQQRPVLDLPWELNYTIALEPNDELTPAEMNLLIVKGHRIVGLGANRGPCGKGDPELTRMS